MVVGPIGMYFLTVNTIFGGMFETRFQAFFNKLVLITQP